VIVLVSSAAVGLTIHSLDIRPQSLATHLFQKAGNSNCNDYAAQAALKWAALRSPITCTYVAKKHHPPQT
jgi:hypothetical protein